MILVYDHKIKYKCGANEEFSQILCFLFHFLQKNVRMKYKMYWKTITFLRLSDDKKVSESSAQTPAQKFYLMCCWIRSLSWAALQLGKRISESHDEKGRLNLQPSLFSSLWLLMAFIYTDPPLLWFCMQFPVLFPLSHTIWTRSLSLHGDMKSGRSGSASLH